MDVACYASLSYMKSNAAHSPGPATGFKYPGQSVRAMPTRILTVGKKRSQGTQLLVDEYKEKLSHYCSVEDVLIRSNPKSTCNMKVQVETEDLLVMQQIRPEDWVVLLDEHGADIGSEQMANLVADASKTGSSRLAFCIGGPYGHGLQVRERADVTIRLSSMVFNHQIALLVLMEQLYRPMHIFHDHKGKGTTLYGHPMTGSNGKVMDYYQGTEIPSLG